MATPAVLAILSFRIPVGYSRIVPLHATTDKIYGKLGSSNQKISKKLKRRSKAPFQNNGISFSDFPYESHSISHINIIRFDFWNGAFACSHILLVAWQATITKHPESNRSLYRRSHPVGFSFHRSEQIIAQSSQSVSDYPCERYRNLRPSSHQGRSR